MRVRRLRDRLGLTQADLAKLIGCGASTIAKIETGRTPKPPKWLQNLIAVTELVLGGKDVHNWQHLLEIITGSGAANRTATPERLPAAGGCPAPDPEGSPDV